MVAMSFSVTRSLARKSSAMGPSSSSSSASPFILDHNYFKSDAVTPAPTSTRKAATLASSSSAATTETTEPHGEQRFPTLTFGENTTDVPSYDVEMEVSTDDAITFLPLSPSSSNDTAILSPTHHHHHHPTSCCNVPTKTCSHTQSETPDFCLASVYTTCQKCATNVSASNVASWDSRSNSHSSTQSRLLKPGDYLPPLFIDTQSYGVCSDVTTRKRSSSRHRVDQPTHSENANYSVEPMEENAEFISYNDLNDVLSRSESFSDVIRWLNASDGAQIPDEDMTHQKPNPCNIQTTQTLLTSPKEHDHSGHLYSANQGDINDGVHHHQGLQPHGHVETPDYSEALGNLDLESLTDLENYLSESMLPSDSFDTLAPPSPPLTPLPHNTDVPSPQTVVKNVEKFPSSGLKLSIFQDRHEFTYNTAPIHPEPLRKQPSSNEVDDVLAWIEDPSFYTSPALSPLSPEIPTKSLNSMESTGDVSNLPSPGYLNCSSDLKQDDLDILDLFSNDSAIAFLSSDSEICKMHVS